MKKIYTIILLTVGVIAGSILTTTLLPQAAAAQECAGVETSIISCGEDANGVWELLSIAIRILTGGVFIAAIGGIVYAAILYTSAGSNQDQVKKARNMITNVVIGIVAFAMMFALFEWLIPGGLFNDGGDIESISLIFNQRELA